MELIEILQPIQTLPIVDNEKFDNYCESLPDLEITKLEQSFLSLQFAYFLQEFEKINEVLSDDLILQFLDLIFNIPFQTQVQLDNPIDEMIHIKNFSNHTAIVEFCQHINRYLHGEHRQQNTRKTKQQSNKDYTRKNGNLIQRILMKVIQHFKILYFQQMYDVSVLPPKLKIFYENYYDRIFPDERDIIEKFSGAKLFFVRCGEIIRVFETFKFTRLMNKYHFCNARYFVYYDGNLRIIISYIMSEPDDFVRDLCAGIMKSDDFSTTINHQIDEQVISKVIIKYQKLSSVFDTLVSMSSILVYDYDVIMRIKRCFEYQVSFPNETDRLLEILNDITTNQTIPIEQKEEFLGLCRNIIDRELADYIEISGKCEYLLK